jgi:hypothetical protein
VLVNRTRVVRYVALIALALSFLFLLAVVVFAFC